MLCGCSFLGYPGAQHSCRTACAAATNLHPDSPLLSLKMMPHQSYFFPLCAWTIPDLTAPAFYATTISPCVGAHSRSPSPSSPIPSMPGAPRKTEGPPPPCTHHAHFPHPWVQHQGPQHCKRVLHTPLSLPVPETRKHSLDRSSAAFGSCQLLQMALHLQILLSSAPTSPAFPSLGYLTAVSGPALCHGNRKVVGTSSSSGMRPAPISHNHWHRPYPCRPDSPFSPLLCSHTQTFLCFGQTAPATNSCLHISLEQARSTYLAFPVLL